MIHLDAISIETHAKESYMNYEVEIIVGYDQNLYLHRPHAF